MTQSSFKEIDTEEKYTKSLCIKLLRLSFVKEKIKNERKEGRKEEEEEILVP